MKKLKLIYNPFSGDKTFKTRLDDCVHVLQHHGYETHLFRSIEKGDIVKHIAEMEKGCYDAVAVSGGDGTVNIVLNALLKNGHDVPLGIIPSGTANDFATFLKIQSDPVEATAFLAKGKPTEVDVGVANGDYFINVCSAGLLTGISHNISQEMKKNLGKLAYYVKGLEQLPNFVPIPVRITNNTEVIEAEIFLFMALNSAGTGGFPQLSPLASVSDGKFDFIAFRACQVVDLAKVFVKVLKGDTMYDPNIIFFQDDYIRIEFLTDIKMFEFTDLDGEEGPPMPVEIRNVRNGIKLLL